MQRKNLAAKVTLAALLSALLVIVSNGAVWATSYDTAVLANLPTCYWKGDTSLADLGSCGSLTGVSVAYAGPTGITSQSNGFDWTGANYAYATLGNWTSSDYTIEFWSKAGSTAGEMAAIWNASGAGLRYYIVVAQGSGSMCIHDRYNVTDDGYCIAVSSGWHLIDFKCSGSTATPYVDGGAVSGISGTQACNGAGGWASGDYVSVGANKHASWDAGGITDTYTQGQESNVAIYHTALSGTDIAAHFAGASGLPAATLTVCGPVVPGSGSGCSPHNITAAVSGHSLLYLFQGTDSTGADVAEDGTTVVNTGSTPSGALSGCVSSTGGLLCTAGAPGIYAVRWDDTYGNTAFSTLLIYSAASAFVVNPVECHTTLSGNCVFRNSSTDAAGNPLGGLDPWSFSSPPTHVTCGSPVPEGGDTAITCHADTVGTYSLVATDAGAHAFTVSMVVAATANPAGCSTVSIGGTTWPDIGCFLGNVLQGLIDLPAQIAGQISAFLFVSHEGKNYVDVSQLVGLIPAVACRSGQAPTHPDGAHCLPFPVSVPFDFAALVSIVNVTPVAPSITAELHAPPIDEHFTVDPTIVLTATVMTWVRGAELLLFMVGLAIGTYRFVQAWGSL